MVLDFVASLDRQNHAAEKILGDLNDVFVVSVGHVKLASGELGIVSQIDSFVTEQTSNLVDTVDSSDNEHFVVELRSDTQEQVHVQIVVMGDKRLGSGSTSNLVHDRGLDFEETEVVEVAAQESDNLAADDKVVLDTRVKDQIQVALAESESRSMKNAQRF